MARRPDPPDDDDVPSRPRATNGRVEAAAPEPDDDSPRPKPLSELSDKGLLKRLFRYTEEYQMLAGDPSPAAVSRRVELTRTMRAVQAVRDAREPLVEVTVPRSVTGEPFTLGPNVYPPGVYHVRASIAQYLLWLISEGRRIEMNRLKATNREIEFGTIGSRAKMVKISRGDVDDDWANR